MLVSVWIGKWWVRLVILIFVLILVRLLVGVSFVLLSVVFGLRNLIVGFWLILVCVVCSLLVGIVGIVWFVGLMGCFCLCWCWLCCKFVWSNGRNYLLMSSGL